MARPAGSRGNGRPGAAGISKCPTGISGLDEITRGGLPRGRPTLVCGSAGCGKTLLGMEFLIRGALDFGETGVCISFEETAEELSANVASLGFEVDKLIEKKKLVIDHVFIERSLVEEAGEYDLEALFVRIGHAVDTIGAKRVVIDSIESLFAGLQNESILRAELRRLFRWLKQRKLTTIITGERGDGELTRHGLEEYVSDCVILLDHRVTETVFTRRLRVVKYRGSTHGTNEYPFLVDQHGISVLPVTSLELEHPASRDRISSGVAALDEMLGGEGGYYRGSSILVSGTAGTGKTSLAAHFLEAGCGRGERCLFFCFEESGEQVMRNLRSIGLPLRRWVDKGLLRFSANRPTTFGLEMHLVQIHALVEEFQPSLVVVDPVTALMQSGTTNEAQTMMLRLVDYLKARQITTLMTALTPGGTALEQTELGISSIVDVWLVLRDIETGGERNRGLYVLKARGMAHSNQIREFMMTSHGVVLRPVYLGEAGVLTGSARVAREAREAAAALEARQGLERKRLELARKRKAIEAQIAVLELDLKTQEQETRQLESDETGKRRGVEEARTAMVRSRAAGRGNGAGKGARK